MANSISTLSAVIKPIQLSSTLHFYLLCLLLNSSDGNDELLTHSMFVNNAIQQEDKVLAKPEMFIGHLLHLSIFGHPQFLILATLMSVKCRFSLDIVQNDVLSPSRMHVTTFSIDQTVYRGKHVFTLCVISVAAIEKHIK